MSKSKKTARPNAASAASAAPARAPISAPLRPISGKREWVFRLGVAVAAPLLVLIALEWGLRLAGYGVPSSFFLPATLDGRPAFIENQDFSQRFFPPGLARNPAPSRMDAPKAPGVKRIFIFGESAALGDPAPAFGLGRTLEMLLRERYPDARFEFVNVSMTAINSHALLPIARDCADKEGDLWVIYMGNNEVVGPFGAGTVFGAKTPPMPLIRASIALKSSRTGQLLSGALARFHARGGAPREWGGMEMFLKQQVAADDPALDRVYSHFDQNLREIIQIGKKSGATIVLSTLAANLKDCAPFASAHGKSLAPSALVDWDKAYREGCRLQASNEIARAVQPLKEAVKLDPGYADAWYRLGQCQLACGNEQDARDAFANALETDTLRFRPDKRVNEIIRQNVKDGVFLADARAEIAAHSPHGLAGDELLYEHVHPTWDGAYWIGRCLAEQAGRALKDLHPASADWLSADECSARLGLTDWDQARTADLMVRRMQEPPFSTQSDWPERDRRARSRAAQYKTRLSEQGIDTARQTLAQAAVRHPDDWQIRQAFAEFLEGTGADAQAADQWTETLRLMPNNADAACRRGMLFDKLGRPAEALACFEQALRWSPDCAAAYNDMGAVYDSQGKSAMALDCYRKAVRIEPNQADFRVNLGSACAGMGLTNEALAAFEAALAARSNNPAALSAIARLLAKTGRADDAIKRYRQAVESAPNDPDLRLSFANTCLAMGLTAEAIDQFAAAVKLRPESAEARQGLGVELAKAGRKEEALAELEQAVRLAPDNAQARYNFGVACAQARRWPEAIAQFREALRIDPGNPQFQRGLDAATARQSQR